MESEIKSMIMKYLILLSTIVFFICSCTNGNIKEYDRIEEEVDIFPDYKNITIPRNIAPLHFRIENDGGAYSVLLSVKDQIESPEIDGNLVRMSLKKWKKLLSSMAGDTIYVSVLIQESSGWKRYKSFYWYVSNDEIDRYMSYRLIDPGYESWGRMSVQMRNISNYSESPIFDNRFSGSGCMNCHTYNHNNPEEFMFHIRGKPGGTVVKTRNRLQFFDTRSDFTMSAGVYPAWHPSGKLIAMSVNRIGQFFSRDPGKTIEVVDFASDLIVFNIEKKEITTCPQISTRDKETMPCWSADGDYLYFIKSPEWKDTTKLTDFKYDLFRIHYDVQNNTWGEVETVFEASRLGKSISMPRISPDGRFMLLTLTEYGNFTIHHLDADLCMYDLELEQFFPLLNVNSDHVDSYHSWSTSGKWILFSSKRLDGVCSRPYIAHIDQYGNASKAFVVPQKDPDYYNLTTQSFNRPELMTGPVSISQYRIHQLIYKEPERITFDPSVDLDALSGATKFSDEYRYKGSEPYINTD
jgi:hypothetical protein